MWTDFYLNSERLFKSDCVFFFKSLVYLWQFEIKLNHVLSVIYFIKWCPHCKLPVFLFITHVLTTLGLSQVQWSLIVYIHCMYTPHLVFRSSQLCDQFQERWRSLCLTITKVNLTWTEMFKFLNQQQDKNIILCCQDPNNLQICTVNIALKPLF